MAEPRVDGSPTIVTPGGSIELAAGNTKGHCVLARPRSKFHLLTYRILIEETPWLPFRTVDRPFAPITSVVFFGHNRYAQAFRQHAARAIGDAEFARLAGSVHPRRCCDCRNELDCRSSPTASFAAAPTGGGSSSERKGSKSRPAIFKFRNDQGHEVEFHRTLCQRQDRQAHSRWLSTNTISCAA